jgi:hypothetical protein
VREAAELPERGIPKIYGTYLPRHVLDLVPDDYQKRDQHNSEVMLPVPNNAL